MMEHTLQCSHVLCFDISREPVGDTLRPQVFGQARNEGCTWLMGPPRGIFASITNFHGVCSLALTTTGEGIPPMVPIGMAVKARGPEISLTLVRFLVVH